MAAARPHFNKSIADLEALHQAAPGDNRLSLQLLDELTHRSTGRAAALVEHLERSLKAHETKQPRLSATPPPLPPQKSQIAPPRSSSLDSLSTAAATESLAQFASTNGAGAVLATWTALEALSPQTYRRAADLAAGDQRCVVSLESGDLPWFQGERSRQNYQLYYQIVLGSIPMDRATDELVKAFGQDEERTAREKEKAAIAAVLVDRNGLLLDENAVAVSSFAWALPIALRGDLSGLGRWISAERTLVNDLTARLQRTNDEGQALPLDRSTIDKAFQWLVETLGLPTGLYEPPAFVLRVFHHFKSKNPPEVALLNSFYLADLSRAATLAQNGKLGAALARYVGAEHVEKCPNLLADFSVLDELIAPSKLPPARWPSPGGHALVTLQQAAVNAARSELAGNGMGTVAVNGPPGTGKTTLLRDLIAACVTDRALAMVAFEDPLAAFRPTGQKIAAGDRAFFHLYSLDESLRGHEVLVASSNNKAVENVSRELPAAKAIGRDLSYFKTVSDRLQAKRANDGALAAGEPTWGLVAAVLGNASNRYDFQQALWWDDDRSFRLYLKAAKGDAVIREVVDGSGEVHRETPSVVLNESPPTVDQAKANWRKARRDFNAIHSQVNAELQKLERVRQACKQLTPALRARSAAEVERNATSRALDRELHEVAIAATARKSAQSLAEAGARLEQQAMSQRPGWFARFFRTAGFKRWLGIYTPIARDKAAAATQFRQRVSEHSAAESRAGVCSAALRRSQERLAAATRVVEALQLTIQEHREDLGDRLVDDHFFEQNHERWNLLTPWVSDSLHAKREDLFAAALSVHRAFIDVAAQKVFHNLNVLMGAMQAGAFHDDARKSLLGDLWSTLFLVVPAMSTTFASVDRMLGDLPPSSIGWLLIDEAGQATPQSAVGALMRARRVIVVGDPLQIPPVVSLPERLVAEVCKHFDVTLSTWAAPDASAQTLADQASRLQAEFRTDCGPRLVGLPLLVHRRCQEPMFGISNRIAYDGQMVHAASGGDMGPIALSLGESAWLDVDGNATSKWCAAEGEVVVSLLYRLASSGLRQPDIYIITPFRVVAQELRRRLESESALFASFDVDADEWLRNRVGTIHTFQGKEAEAVIAILGAPMAAQQGARRWAAGTPNILNVMVTRAKQAVYVIGSRAAWGSVGHCQTLASALPVRRFEPNADV